MTQANDPKAKRRVNVLDISWSGFDLLLVIGALLAGFLIWFAPSFWDTPELRVFYARQKELKAQEAALAAEDARIQKENEELGIVYLPPPPPKTGTTTAAKAGAKPKTASKPAPKKKDK